MAFADDIVIFVNGSSGSLKALSEVLQLYQDGSEQKINYSKSFFVTSKHCRSGRVAAMSQILAMQCTTLPFRYLGVNMFTGRNRTHYYQHLLEKIDNKLLGWQRKLLSEGGRLTLIKRVLTMIPMYTMASVTLPKHVVRSLEAKLANFFWGSFEGKPKRHWVK
ncbi:PREDICTED: uncharacterized protein LOC109170965 [Ipomoea nil]|uniref:uncharacterized protein LOC109170965 n=1 Tax=Ipomoea nil TaxID=35883 RepID=UPI000901FC10|nr:PREDICTED: uncharacterized protein LOC109170965 [Ipomoea nil]